MVKQISSQAQLDREFQKAGDKAVIVDFYATWCPPCTQIAPKVAEYARKYEKVVVLKVDVDECDEVATKYRVNSMPTFKVFMRGEVVESMSGASETRLEGLFRKYNK